MSNCELISSQTTTKTNNQKYCYKNKLQHINDFYQQKQQISTLNIYQKKKKTMATNHRQHKNKWKKKKKTNTKNQLGA